MAFADREKIMTARIVDVLGNRNIGNIFAGLGKCTLIFDVVETGTLAMDFTRKLTGLGVALNTKVLSAINKCGAKSVKMGEFHIESLLVKDNSPDVPECLQCSLRLPHIPEGEESAGPIRTFDILHMSSQCGWEPEPSREVPDNIGKGYPWIPKFGKILQEYGDWLGYKLHLLLKSGICPDDWFIIHPDEGDSGSLVDKLRVWIEDPVCVVSVPREAIKKAQNRGNWDAVIEAPMGEHWVSQLKSISSASALIVDIFNASGYTANSLGRLLNYFNIPTFGYLCMVNFNPGNNAARQSSLRVFSLYDWFNPRTLQGGN